MKKSLLALSLTVILFSCKKDEAKTDFTATDVTGTTVVKGNCTKNIITPDGTGGWSSASTIPAAGVAVSIKVNKSELYPNSIAQGADMYTGVTDALGNYAITVKTNATGVSSWMTISGFTGTLDTLINGVTKTGLYANYFGSTNNVNLWMGMTVQRPVKAFTATNLTSNPNNIMIGSALVSGLVTSNQVLSTKTGTNPAVITTTNMAVPAGVTIYVSLDKDPTSLAPRLYTTTTDALGRYSFNLPTVALGTSGFNQDGTIWVADRSTTRDTVRVINGVNTTPITGPTGVFNRVTITELGLYNNENRNGADLNNNAGTWVPN